MVSVISEWQQTWWPTCKVASSIGNQSMCHGNETPCEHQYQNPYHPSPNVRNMNKSWEYIYAHWAGPTIFDIIAPLRHENENITEYIAIPKLMVSFVKPRSMAKLSETVLEWLVRSIFRTKVVRRIQGNRYGIQDWYALFQMEWCHKNPRHYGSDMFLCLFLINLLFPTLNP